LGEVCVALKYEPDVGKLTLDILAATKLKEMDGFQRSCIYKIFYSFEFLQKSIEMENSL
jgi:hypothetical protein